MQWVSSFFLTDSFNVLFLSLSSVWVICYLGLTCTQYSSSVRLTFDECWDICKQNIKILLLKYSIVNSSDHFYQNEATVLLLVVMHGYICCIATGLDKCKLG